MTIEAAALVLGMSADYLHVGIREGRIPAHRFGRSYRLRRDFIYGFVATPSGARFEDFAAAWMAREASVVEPIYIADSKGGKDWPDPDEQVQESA